MQKLILNKGGVLSLMEKRMSLVKDYFELTKPRVVLLMIITSSVGMLLASKQIDWVTIVFCNLGIALMAGCAACVNHLVDHKIDRQMQRTKNRPVAKGRVTVLGGSVFAFAIGALGFWLIMKFGNLLATLLTLASLVGYALVYTIYLKRATPQNIVIGGLAGATPPLLGWVCISNSIDAEGLLLALIIFVWTPPHFWALALYRIEDYRKVNIPMLPITHGEGFTRLQIACYCVLLLIVSLLPWMMKMFGWIYLVSALLLGCVFMYYALVLIKRGQQSPKLYMTTFRFSIVYIALLFSAMLSDHYLL